MKDYIVSAIAANGTVRAFVANTKNTVQEAKNIHDMAPTPSVALGRTLTAGCLMSKTLKGENTSLTIQIKGKGPIGGIVVVAKPDGSVKGYVNNPVFDFPLNDEGKFDIGGAVGKGILNIVKDLGLREPYVGNVELISGEIAEDITYYFASSEQIPTVTILGVLVDKDESILASGGILIQLMPGAADETIEHIEKRVMAMPHITTLLEEGMSIEDILSFLIGGLNMTVLEKTPTEYKCNCSRQRMERNIITLGKQELEDIIKEQGEAETNCFFCDKKYYFSKDDLESMLESATKKD